MKVVTKFEADNGEIFNTQIEAVECDKNEEIKRKLTKLIEIDFHSRMDSEDIVNLLMENKNTIKEILN